MRRGTPAGQEQPPWVQVLDVTPGGERWQRDTRTRLCSISGLHLPACLPTAGKQSESRKHMFWGRRKRFQARMRTDSLSDTTVIFPRGQRQIFNHILKLVQIDLINKFNSRTVLFFSRSAAEVLWFVLTLKIQNKICANDIRISQLVLATLLLLCRTSASTNANTRTLLRAECPTFRSNHSNYKTCNKTVSALNE